MLCKTCKLPIIFMYSKHVTLNTKSGDWFIQGEQVVPKC